MNEQTITLSGMTCGACIKLVTKILSRTEEVKNVLTVDQGIAKVSVNIKYTKESFAKVFAGTPYTVESVS
ncbi:MAG: heavy-metal-associated domain-containing protein [Patescibacteria group bacterium]